MRFGFGIASNSAVRDPRFSSGDFFCNPWRQSSKGRTAPISVGVPKRTLFRDGKGKLLHFVSMVGKIAHCTPDDLLDVAEEGLFELVDGKLVEKQMSSPAGRTAALLAQRLISHLERTRAGELMVGATFRCFPNDPDRVRRPDLPFVAALNAARLPPEGHIPFAPDLVIEVTARTPRK